MAMGFKYLYYNEQKGDDAMAYEIKLSFEKWDEFLNFMTDLHNREMRNMEEANNMDENKFQFKNLEDADEDIEALIQQYPVAFENTSESEIRKIHRITEKMGKRPGGCLKPASEITIAYIFSRIKDTFASEEFFLALPLAIAALFLIRCGDKFEDSKNQIWQDEMDLSLFLLMEFGFNSKGIRNAISLLDEYNLIDIDKDYSQDKKNPRITYRPNEDLYNLLLEDEIPY